MNHVLPGGPRSVTGAQPAGARAMAATGPGGGAPAVAQGRPPSGPARPPSGPAAEGSEGDPAIIRASLSEPERFAALFDRHAPVIYRYLASRAGRTAADDLTAETFLAAFRRRASYDLACADALPWLYGVATRVLAQHRRDDARQLRIRLAAIPDLSDPGHGDRVAGDVTAGALRGALADVLAGLSAGDRDVLLLIAWEQLSYDEVARALEIPVGTVRSRLNRARTRLRGALAGTEFSATIKEVLDR
jgi:RNA polymerase sigma factor (sigma-70 family)